MSKMENTIIMDKSGRIVIPKKVRSKFKTNRFELHSDAEKIELIPIKPLGSLFGSIPDLDIDKIKKEHEKEAKNDRF